MFYIGQKVVCISEEVSSELDEYPDDETTFEVSRGQVYTIRDIDDDWEGLSIPMIQLYESGVHDEEHGWFELGCFAPIQEKGMKILNSILEKVNKEEKVS